ncbi:ATP-binding protein [Roseicella sp. DB1501]|uniref:ATP-binding protein n=1 Tax=Roseicella sp. DB1501 TaxID=2730925 RepID=UPI0014925A88|nr:ATP-binding protein [Roseicella sp. DB1501]NOG70581.1 response regulator [Roseicella sp. DB1501]
MPSRIDLRRARILSVAVLLAGFALATVVVAMLLEAREESWNRAILTARNASRAVASDLARTIQGFDLQLLAAAEAGDETGTALRVGPACPEAAATCLPAPGQILLLDADSPPGWAAGILGEEALRFHRAHADGDLHIGRPGRGRPGNGRGDGWVVPLSRAVGQPDGTIRGVLVITLPLATLRPLLERMELGLKGALTLLREDGAVILRLPEGAPAAGEPAGSWREVPREMLAAASGDDEFVGFARRDGVERLQVLSRIEGTPLLLMATVATAAIDAPWRRQAWITGGATLLLMLCLAAATAMMQRDFGRRRMAEAAARNAATTAAVARDVAMRAQALAEERREMAERAQALEEENRQLAEARAQAADRLARQRSEILAVMAHEIRTPLTGVIGFAELLATADLPAESHGHAETVLHSGKVLLAVVNDLLDLAKLEAGKISIESVAFSPPELLRQSLDLAWPLAGRKGLRMALDLAPDLPKRASGDPIRLRQVIDNLIGNAVKFTEAGGITLRAMSRAGVAPGGTGSAETLLRIEVIDTGIGIAPEAVPRLFTMFEQAEAGPARRFGGTGLGLAICRRLLEAMQGRIGVESVPGQGSRFWFEVPLALAEGVPQAEAPGLAGPPVPTAPRRVLVVDDVEANRILVRTHLERAGHAVTLAADGSGAVDAAARQRFDLILLDVHMPVMDGPEAARRIRAGGPNAATPIMALTADVSGAQRTRLEEAGMNAALTKPASPAALLAAVAGCPISAPPDDGTPVLDPEIIAEIDRLLGRPERDAMLSQSLAEATEQLGRCGGLLSSPAELRFLAHRLAGGLLSVGAMAAGRAAQKLERAAATASGRAGAARPHRHPRRGRGGAAAGCAVVTRCGPRKLISLLLRVNRRLPA